MTPRGGGTTAPAASLENQIRARRRETRVGQDQDSCYSVRGKLHIASSETADLKAARRFHKGKLDDIAADRQGLKKFIAPTQQRITVGELHGEWKADIELSGLKSAKKTLHHSKAITEHFGTMRAVDVTPAVVDRFVKQQVAAGLANATVNRQTQVLGAILKLAVERGKLTTIPKIRKLSEKDNVRRVFYAQQDVADVLAHAPTTWSTRCASRISPVGARAK